MGHALFHIKAAIAGCSATAYIHAQPSSNKISTLPSVFCDRKACVHSVKLVATLHLLNSILALSILIRLRLRVALNIWCIPDRAPHSTPYTRQFLWNTLAHIPAPQQQYQPIMSSTTTPIPPNAHCHAPVSIYH